MALPDWDEVEILGLAERIGTLRLTGAYIASSGQSLTRMIDDIDVQVNTNTAVTIPNLEAIVGVPAYTDECNIATSEDLATSIDELDMAIGCRTYTEQNYILNAEKIVESLDALDMILKDEVDTYQAIDVYDSAGGQTI